jgi:hypothetical protein
LPQRAETPRTFECVAVDDYIPLVMLREDCEVERLHEFLHFRLHVWPEPRGAEIKPVDRG